MSMTADPLDLPLSLGERFAAARKKAHLDQTEFGKLVDVDRTTISRWERDVTIPPFDAIVTLSRVSGWSLNHFAAAIVTDTSPDTPPGQVIDASGWFSGSGRNKSRVRSVAA